MITPRRSKKGQRPRQAQRKTRKLAVQTSSKKVVVRNNDGRRAYGPMTAFPEFAIPADTASYREIGGAFVRLVGNAHPERHREQILERIRLAEFPSHPA